MCVCVHKPNVHSDGRAYCVKLSGHMRKQTFPSFTVKQRLPLTRSSTHTPTHPGPSLHSQSQIRWQIRRLMLLGRRGVGVSPSSPGRTPRHIHKPHTHFIVGLRLHRHTHTSHRCLKIPPPIQVPAFSFTLSLFYPSLCLFLPASLLLPSVALQPIRQEVTS